MWNINGVMQFAVRCDGCVLVVVLDASHTHTRPHAQSEAKGERTPSNIYHEAVTETNSWVAGPASITGRGKIAQQRGEEGRGDELDWRDWTEME